MPQVGISSLYMALLFKARHAIWEEHPSELSRALSFLTRDYESQHLYWELVR